MLSALFLSALLTAAPKPATIPTAELSKIRALESQSSEFQKHGQYLDAVKPLQDAITRRSKFVGSTDIDVLNDWMNLAVAYRRHGKADKAVGILERVVEDLGKCTDPSAPQLKQAARNNLASAYRSTNQPEKARALWEALVKENDQGKPTEDLALTLDNLAAILSEMGRYDEAKPYSERGTKTWRALRGEDDVDVAISLATLGNLKLARGDLKGARTVLNQSIKTLEKLRGADHPEVGGVLNVLAVVEFKDKKFGAARTAWERSLAIGQKLDPRADQVVEAQQGLELLKSQGH